jgi:hypothetical protein
MSASDRAPGPRVMSAESAIRVPRVVTHALVWSLAVGATCPTWE